MPLIELFELFLKYERGCLTMESFCCLLLELEAQVDVEVDFLGEVAPTQ